MKFKVIVLICCIVNVFTVLGQNEMTKEHRETVARFIAFVKNSKKDSVAAMVSFPLKKEYPIPAINNRQEFLKRYDEVFDEKLIRMISNSDPAKDWSAVGYRGMMLHRGDVWLDYDGTLLGVNYQSAFEVKEKNRLIVLDKNRLYKPLRDFKQPVHILQTDRHIIRIDQMADGTYRYASWKKGQPMGNKPEIVVSKGEFIPEGSGGNHSYVFKNGTYKYECEIIIVGEDDAPPAYMNVYKAGKKIQSLKADVITRI
ncbi:MAG: hypothetical protein ACLGH8_16230 [Bacteroidia bacterium]